MSKVIDRKEESKSSKYKSRESKSRTLDKEDSEKYFWDVYKSYVDTHAKKTKEKKTKKYFASELKSFKRDNAYLVFSANGNYITSPTCFTTDTNVFKEKKRVNFPVGSCKYMTTHSLGNAFDSFVFCNIKKENENKLFQRYIHIHDKKREGINRRRRSSYNKYINDLISYDCPPLEREISGKDLKDLEKMLLYRSKPRLEKPYRIIADQKNCVKYGSSFSGMLRKGL